MSFLLIPTEYKRTRRLNGRPGIKIKRECFTPSKGLETFERLCRTEDSFEQNLMVRSLLEASFKPRGLELKIDAIPIYTLYI